MKITKKNATLIVLAATVIIFLLCVASMFGLQVYHDLNDGELTMLNKEALISKHLETSIVVGLISTVPIFLACYFYMLKPKLDALPS